MRHKPPADDMAMISFLKQFEIPFAVVLTKSDKLKKKEYASQKELIINELGNPEYPVIPFSSVTGEGVEEIKCVIEKALEK